MLDLPREMKMSHKGGEERTFMLRECVQDDVNAIVALQAAVYGYLPDKDIFANTKRDEFIESIDLDYCYCFMDDDEMIAFTLMVANRMGYRNYGEYLGYSEEQMKQTVSMDTSFVLPTYRGYGFQKCFFDIREEAARKIPGVREALTTIAPDNSYSLNNAYKSGFEEITRMTIYGGLERCILRKVF